MNQGRLAAYSAGNKVYGAGRPHPTSGPVDPTGYIERNMKKDSSNRRSGLAAAATRRLQGGMPESSQLQQPVAPGQGGPNKPFFPINLPDGGRVVPNAKGQYEFYQDRPSGAAL